MFFFLQNICGKKKQFSSFIIILRKKKHQVFFLWKIKEIKQIVLTCEFKDYRKKKVLLKNKTIFLEK